MRFSILGLTLGLAVSECCRSLLHDVYGEFVIRQTGDVLCVCVQRKRDEGTDGEKERTSVRKRISFVKCVHCSSLFHPVPNLTIRLNDVLVYAASCSPYMHAS
jgi:hypothetical protein